MSRLAKYRESIERFMKNNEILKDCPIDIKEYTKDNDYFLPITLLTIFNSQSKKNNVASQGYYVASCVVLIHILMDNEFSKEITIELLFILNRLLYCNLDNSKDFVPQKKIGNVILSTLKIYETELTNVMKNPIQYIELSDNSLSVDVSKWYLKDDAIEESLKKAKMINKSSFEDYLNNTVCSLCNIVFGIGWVMGCGGDSKMDKMKKISYNFGIIYKLSHDFDNLKKDASNLNQMGNNTISYNYILNYGFDDAYGRFMESKYKLIEGLMVLEVNTQTIKEIINNIDHKVDLIIDETSPDTKSNYSCIRDA